MSAVVSRPLRTTRAVPADRPSEVTRKTNRAQRVHIPPPPPVPAIPTGYDDEEWIWGDDLEEIMESTFEHVTVMREELVSHVAVRDGWHVDATLGGGGHAEALLEANPSAKVLGFDRDPVALAHCQERLARFGGRVRFVHAPFSEIEHRVEEAGVGLLASVYADLGVSSVQIDQAERGMSFRREGPIDMRMDPTRGQTALELLTELDDDELANIIYKYGEERRSRRIARSVKRALLDGELHTTFDLRRAIVRAVGPVRVGGVDPATRTFQALRIAVNDELGELEELLRGAASVLATGGRFAIITFHSLEDRIVKHTFRDSWTVVTKKPIIPQDAETDQNGRARSAKLRVAEKPEAAVENGESEDDA